jgi:hypothetical protein
MRTNIVAADLTGTYDSHSELHGEVDLIITGESWENYNEIMDSNDIDIPIFWNPGKTELMDIVGHKAEILTKTGAIKFYEDQKIQADLLKTMVPECHIILVKPNLYSIT